MCKTVLITGSSRGIGLACARAFFLSGYNVALNCVKNEKDAAQAAACLNSADKPNKAIFYKADVSRFDACKELVDFVKRSFSRVDCLINNAGKACAGLFTQMSERDYTDVIQTNLLSAMHLSRLILPDMAARREGVIINISSVWGVKGASCEAAYAASKGGLNALTLSLAKEYGPCGIRVNAISCGAIDTDMNNNLTEEEKNAFSEKIALGRFGAPGEIAQTALFLASDAASYITGAVVSADGGM